VRLFIAIKLNEEMEDALLDIQDIMDEHGVRGNYTKAENLHLTLAFIGEYDDPEAVKNIIDAVEMRPFEISLGGIGSFRRLWWAGISGENGRNKNAALIAVAKRLRKGLDTAEIPFDRKKFSPHITLIRTPSCGGGREPDEVFADILREVDAYFDKYGKPSMTVGHISLMRSDRGKHGMIYTEL
jgi:2'-5' RNA ligase